MTGQLQLDVTPPPEPLPLPDQRVEAEARPRLGKQCLAILRRLQEGPATGEELQRIAHRYGARIWDLKRRAGYDIRLIERRAADGFTKYQLFTDGGVAWD